MARLRFQNEEAAVRVIADLEITAYVEGGVGPVKLGRPALHDDGSATIDHPFSLVDLHWIQAYADDPELTIEE